MSRLKRPPVGVVWKLWCCPCLFTMVEKVLQNFLEGKVLNSWDIGSNTHKSLQISFFGVPPIEELLANTPLVHVPYIGDRPFIAENRLPPLVEKTFRKLITKDRGRIIADKLQINRESLRQIVTLNLGMRKTYCRLVPHHLTDDQKHLEAS
ncbi:hypothetical protein TNCV_4296901 [Trichonephila clavipes]|nr:hypothetical protein TNCV_4296901 [Trichonephila clavipes]